MKSVDSTAFAARHPVLFHMSSAGAWPSILQHGLLSAKEIMRLHGVGDAVAAERLRAHRVQAEQLGDFWIRDQKPMNMKMLRHVLEDCTPEEWLYLLNARVFFSPTSDRLSKLLKSYAHRRNLVLEIDTKRLLKRYGAEAEVCRLNSGAVRHVSHKRSPASFVRFKDYLGKPSDVAELIIPDKVPDIGEYVIRAYETGGGAPDETLFLRSLVASA
jgi:hypothetical protein